MNTIKIIKSNLIKQMRSPVFLLLLISSIFLGWLCVPSSTDGYEIFYMAGVRGIYNSAWLGTMAAIVSTIILWLPGFYLLRSQISEDKRLKIGEITAATPISKIKYIAGKVLSNFIILCLLEILFIASFMVMQFIRGESNYINISDYMLPFIIVTAPYLFVLAALTLLFDTLTVLKGSLGNILIFIIWLIMTAISMDAPGSPLDLFAVGKLLSAMLDGARSIYPTVPTECGSFGIYPHTEDTLTFNWDGIFWDSTFMTSRITWIIVAIAICILTAILFDRFKKNAFVKKEQNISAAAGSQIHNRIIVQPLPSVKRTKRTAYFTLIKGEIRILSAGLNKWWFLLFLASFVSSWLIPLEQMRWGSLILLLPLPLWSQSGCDMKQYYTKELLVTSEHHKAKWLASWLVGISLSMFLSVGIILRYLSIGELSHAFAWLAGAAFIPTLALALGSLCESSRLFEGIYIVWFYFGCISNINIIDFLGIQNINIAFYLILTIILLIVGRLSASLKDN